MIGLAVPAQLPDFGDDRARPIAASVCAARSGAGTEAESSRTAATADSTGGNGTCLNLRRAGSQDRARGVPGFITASVDPEFAPILARSKAALGVSCQSFADSSTAS